jgi:DNA-binding Lrp family transcriptional regulator
MSEIVFRDPDIDRELDMQCLRLYRVTESKEETAKMLGWTVNEVNIRLKRLHRNGTIRSEIMGCMK